VRLHPRVFFLFFSFIFLFPGLSLNPSVFFAGKYCTKRAVQEALEKSGLGYMYVTSYCLTSFWGPGLGMLGHAQPPVETVEVLGDGSAKGGFCLGGCIKLFRYCGAVLL
jgi:hypothetical protein